MTRWPTTAPRTFLRYNRQMIIALAVFAFILGTIVGSFLNVVILRYNTGRSINGRSNCMSCGYKLAWYDLIPIASWLWRRGRCRRCAARISPQYPLVEAGTGALFAVLMLASAPLIPFSIGDHVFTNLATLFFTWHAVIFSILIVIFVYDLRHKIIPNSMSYTFAALALIQTLLVLPPAPEMMTINYLNLLAGPILFLPFFLLWFVSRGRWIGLGDGKLALGIGWYLGFINGISAVVLAFWIGAIFAIALMLIARLKQLAKNITMKTEIPFAPFLIVGMILQFFLRIDFLSIGLFF